MTKLYGVNCCAIVCVIICVVSCCVGVTKILPVYNYILYGQTMRPVHTLITLFATLLLLLLLLFIVIYDYVGPYNKTIIMFGMLVNDDVTLLVEFVVTSVSMSVPIRSPQEIYYTSIPSIYIQLGDAVDCFI